jgi:hypothetical protein
MDDTSTVESMMMFFLLQYQQIFRKNAVSVLVLESVHDACLTWKGSGREAETLSKL